jgi:hypothetical protein
MEGSCLVSCVCSTCGVQFGDAGGVAAGRQDCVECEGVDDAQWCVLV